MHKIKWDIIFNIYQNVIQLNLLKKYKNPYFKIILNNNINLEEIESPVYNDNFIMILY